MNWKECPATLSAMLMIALTTFMKGITLVYSILILNKERRNFFQVWEGVLLYKIRRVPVSKLPFHLHVQNLLMYPNTVY